MITDATTEDVQKGCDGSTMRTNKVDDEIRIETAAQAAALIRAALPKEQKEERVVVLPLDGNAARNIAAACAAVSTTTH